MSKNIEVKKEAAADKKNGQAKEERGLASPLGLNQFISRFFGGRLQPFSDWPEFSRNSFHDIQETDTAYVLTAEIPGLPKEAVDIQINGNLLSVKAEHKEEEGTQDSPQYSRRYHSFHQSFTLPSNVMADQIEAHCENGVLEIILPKGEVSQAKKIEIKSGSGKHPKHDKKH